MGFRDHGYYGYAFIGIRPLQVVSLIAVIGMSANFVSDDARVGIAAPSQILATLVISCLALLWSLVSFTAYDDTHFPYIVTAAADAVFSLPFIVIAGILGKPLPATTCSALPVKSSTNSSGFLALSMGSRTSTDQGDYIVFVGDNQTTCYAIMATWGLVIALCVLFSLSAIAIGLLILGHRRAAAASGGVTAGTGAYPASYPANESQIEMARAPAKEMSDAGSMNSFDQYDNYDQQRGSVGGHDADAHDSYGPGTHRDSQSPTSPTFSAYEHQPDKDEYDEHAGYSQDHEAYAAQSQQPRRSFD